MMSEAQSLQRAGRVAEAIAAYQRLLSNWPRIADAWFNLGILMRQSRQYADALTAYQNALTLQIAGPEEVHVNRAVILRDVLRRDDLAERDLEAALAANPSFIPALLNLANLHEDRGRREAAAELYRRALAIDPACLEALARLANLLPAAECDAGVIAELRAGIANPAALAAERAALGFALGRALDATGRYAEAFAAYQAANAASRANLPPQLRYDRAAQEQFVDRLIAARLPEPAVSAGVTDPRPRPIFICGLFRSGSTLLEHVLAGVPGVVAGGELDLLPGWAGGELAPFPESLAGLGAAQIESLRNRYLDALATLAPGARFVTDKRPDNFLYVGLIKTLFPDALIVHTTRDPLDTCLSVYFLHLDHRMSYALDLADIGHYFRQYRRLMAHWQARFGADIVDVSYDAFVREPEAATRTLFAALALPWENRLIDFAARPSSVKTASVWQVREPLYRRSSGRAAHYRDALAPLADALADLMPAPAEDGDRP